CRPRRQTPRAPDATARFPPRTSRTARASRTACSPRAATSPAPPRLRAARAAPRAPWDPDRAPYGWTREQSTRPRARRSPQREPRPLLPPRARRQAPPPSSARHRAPRSRSARCSRAGNSRRLGPIVRARIVSRELERQRPIRRARHQNVVTVLEAAVEHRQRERILQIALNRPLERSSTECRIEALFRQHALGLRRELERELSIGQQLLQPLQLQLHDVLDLI